MITNNLAYNNKTLMFVICMFFANLTFAQNTNITNLLTSNQWGTLFPKRAGISPSHPQGYKTDFFSFNNLKQAIDEMSDYTVQIKFKTGIWGNYITVTRKSTNQTYVYSPVQSSWHTSLAKETTINVDFATFVNGDLQNNNKRELAAFLANISKETTGGWNLPVGGGAQGDYAKWGLYYAYELGYNSTNAAGAYSFASTDYPPNPKVGYYGRGPMQLSYNDNYGKLSTFLFNDKNVLLNNPDSLQKDGVLAFKSAIWFWMMPQCPKPSCHQVMHDLWRPIASEYPSAKMYLKGFAHTNNIINGGLECRSTSTQVFIDKVTLRSELYKYYLGILGFNSAQILAENSGDYTTICNQSSTQAMDNYSNCYYEPILTSISNIENDKPSIYPNPVTGILNIVQTNIITKIELVDIYGQILKTFNVDSFETQINVSDINSGIYTIRVYSNNKIKNTSVIIN